jgi:GT2 family glycosyltransferase
MVSIILVNWRGWQDTILCLQSVFRLRSDRFRVIVCDNASGDESVPMLRAWAAGRLSAWVTPAAAARAHAIPAAGTPTTAIEHMAGELVVGGAPERLVLLHTGANLGFAGGCNAGIRYALERGDCDAVWLLNNDTVVDEHALDALLNESDRHRNAALVSSRVVNMNRPDTPWFEGGEFRPLTGAARHVSASRFRRARQPYLSGCSLFIPRSVLDRVGLLDDSFFMYGEDVDYSIRARAAGTELVLAERSVVLHAEGASLGPASPTAYRNLVASGLRLTRRYFGSMWLVPAVAYHVAKLTLLWAVKRRSRASLSGYWRGIVSGLRS